MVPLLTLKILMPAVKIKIERTYRLNTEDKIISFFPTERVTNFHLIGKSW